MLTARPTTSSGRTSTSPVWTPARTLRPIPRAPATMSVAARTAGVEGGVEPVAGGLDLTTSMALQAGAEHGVVRVGQRAPLAVAQASGLLRRRDDVREQDCGGDHVAFGGLVRAGQELLDLVEEGVGVAHEEQVVVAGQLDVGRAGDALGEVATGADPDEAVPGSMQDQCGDGKGREQRPHILTKDLPHPHGHSIHPDAEACAPCPPRPECFVARFAGSRALQAHPHPPHFTCGGDISAEGLRGKAPGVVVLPHVVGEGVDEDQRRDPLGMGRSATPAALRPSSSRAVNTRASRDHAQ
jgi:hypothetical protein